MGPVAYAMLAKLLEAPDHESGFRAHEVATSALARGWVKPTWQSGRIFFYAITDEGREAFITAHNKRLKP